MEFVANSIRDLDSIVSYLLEHYTAPTVFVLQGEMGAGKTTLIRTYCERRGVQDASSPTFGFVNEYFDREGQRIYHFDLYRLRSLEEALDIGFEDYLDGKSTIFIEWADHVISLLDDYRTIAIEVTPTSRIFRID